jgi:phage virion morphogenesis protein
MAGVNIKIEHKIKPLRGVLERLQSATGDLAPFWRDVGEYLLRQAAQRFDTGKDPQGRAWKRLSPRTLRRKKISKILVESGRLSRLVYQVAPTELRVGTNLKYAAIHQFGGEIERPERTQTLLFKRNGQFMSKKAAARLKRPPRKVEATIKGGTTKIPARPFLGINSADEREIRMLLEEHLRRAAPEIA